MANADISNSTTTFNQPNNTPKQWDETSITELWALRKKLAHELNVLEDKELEAAKQHTLCKEAYEQMADDITALGDYLLQRSPKTEKEALPLIYLAKEMLGFTKGSLEVSSKINDILGQVNFTTEIA